MIEVIALIITVLIAAIPCFSTLKDKLQPKRKPIQQDDPIPQPKGKEKKPIQQDDPIPQPKAKEQKPIQQHDSILQGQKPIQRGDPILQPKGKGQKPIQQDDPILQGQKPIQQDDSILKSNIEEILNLRLGAGLPEKETEGMPSKLNILCAGLQHSGKSSLVNTFMRVLQQEWTKPYQFHCIPAPSGGDNHVTRLYTEYVPIIVTPDPEDPKAKPKREPSSLCFFDCKASNGSVADLNFFQKCVSKGLRRGSTSENPIEDATCRINASILVISPGQLENEGTKSHIKQLVDVLKQADRTPIIVITYKDDINEEEDCQRKAGALCGTHQVLFIENYVPGDLTKIPERNLTTDKTVLRLVEMCALNAEAVFHVENKYKA